MMKTFIYRLDTLSARLAPACITISMVLLAAVLGRIPGFGAVMPSFALIAIYYWCMFYPGSLPYIFLFVLGMVQDTLAGQPLGVSSLMNIVAALLLASRFQIAGVMSFASVWNRFIVFSAAVIFLEWAVIQWYYAKIIPVMWPFIHWLASFCAYPAAHTALAYLSRRINE